MRGINLHIVTITIEDQLPYIYQLKPNEVRKNKFVPWKMLEPLGDPTHYFVIADHVNCKLQSITHL